MMSKQLPKAQEIAVKTNMAGVPVSLTRNGRRERVTGIYQRWRLSDQWWGKKVERDYFRIGTSSGIVLDICRDSISNRWYLDKIHD
jgi:hypothetical protein